MKLNIIQGSLWLCKISLTSLAIFHALVKLQVWKQYRGNTYLSHCDEHVFKIYFFKVYTVWLWGMHTEWDLENQYEYKLHFKERILPIIKHLYQLCLYFPIMFYLVTEVVSTLFTEVKEKHNQIMLCCEQCFGVRSCSWFVTCQSIYGIRYFNYCIF